MQSSLHAREDGQLLLHELDTLSLTQPDVFRQRLDALKHKHRRSEQQLHQLVATKHTQLQTVIDIYDGVSERIGATRQRVSDVRQNLIGCLRLLRCRRDELKKLWLEGVELNHQLLVLDTVQRLRQLPAVLQDTMARGRLYSASLQLATARQQMEEAQLQCVGALHETRAHLDRLAERVHVRLLDQLHQHVYEASVSSLQSALKRRGSARSSARDRDRQQIATAHCLPDHVLTEQQLAAMERERSDASSPLALAVVLEALVLLRRLADTVEAVRARIGGQLTALVSRVTQVLLDQKQQSAGGSGTDEQRSDDEDTALFTELVTSLTEQLTAVADTHERALFSLRRSAVHHKLDTLPLHSMDEVWQRVQQTLQTVVVDYLDADRPPAHISVSHAATSMVGGTSESATRSTVAPVANLSSYFSRKRAARVSSRQLFSFAGSSTSLNVTAYVRDKRRAEGADENALAVAARLPVVFSAASITCVCRPLLALADHIERRPGQAAPCVLRVFIADYIGDVLLARLRTQGQQLVERRLHDWQDVAESEGVAVLQSTLVVQRFIESLRRLMTALPSHCNHLLSIVCAVLVQYKEAAAAQLATATRCSRADDVTEAGSSDTLVLSASWARDADISRFLREQPGWLRQRNADCDDVVDAGDESRPVSGSHTRRETDVLAANLGDTEIAATELIAELHTLRWLAFFHESLCRLSSYVTSMCAGGAELRDGGVPESSVQTLVQLARDVRQLADTALLVLHLEVRVDCFHHLAAMFCDATHCCPAVDRCELHPALSQLTDRLTAAHALLQPVLAPARLRYVFGDVSPLASDAVVAGVARIDRVNAHGVKWLLRNTLALQQTLASLNERRDTGLERAKLYLQLLLSLDADCLLQHVCDRGTAGFSAAEYGQLLKLMHRSQPAAHSVRLHANLERLHEIIEDNH